MTKWMVGLAALLTLVLAPSAWADYGQVGQFADQAADGNPVHQQRIAVNATTHTVYVADTVGDQVRVFTPSGTSATEGAPFGAGDLTDPLGIAIDNDTGDVYVSDDDDVLKYSSAGVRDNTFPSLAATGPLAFDQTANELVVGAGTVVRRFSTVGNAGATFDGTSGSTAFAGIQDLAVDSAGNVVVVDSDGNPAQGTGTSRVERFAADGTHQLTFGPVPMAATVAIEPGTDRVAVSGNQDGNVRGELPTVTVFDPATPGTPVGSAALPGSLLYSSIRALAFDGSRLYVGTDVGDYFGGFDYGSATIQVFEAGPDPRVVAASNITADSATLNGTINPQGGGTDTTYRFETSNDGGGTWTAVDPDTDGDENAGQGTSDVPVSETLTGLSSTTSYQVRLVAVRGSVSITSPARTFTTADQAPEAVTGDASVTGVTAALRGLVTPNGGETTYVFEYGTTTAYGQQHPATPRSVANTRIGDRLAVTTIVGLQPSTTYHYRLVATNGGGTATGDDATFTTLAAPAASGVDDCPNAAIRAQQHAQGLGECRAYEQVSPVSKFGNSVDQNTTVQTSADGTAVAYAASGAFADAATSISGGYYIGQRATDEWVNKGIDAPQSNTLPAYQTGRTSLFFTDDLSATIQFSQRALAAGAVDQGSNLYHRTNSTGAMRTLLARPGAALTGELVPLTTRPLVAASRDLSHFVINSEASLVPDAVRGTRHVYDLTDDTVTLVDRLPDGSVPAGGGVVASGSEARESRPVSEDGRRIYFTSPDNFGLGVLYLRSNGGVTRAISVSRRPDDVGALKEVSFAGASADGSIVYFVSAQTLAADDAIGFANYALYRYEVESDRLTNLTIVSDPADITARVQKVRYISKDGSTVYFSASSVLAPGAVSGAENFYVWRAGVIDFIGPDVYGGPQTYAGSQNGRYLAFASSSSLTGIGNSGADDMYLYDAVARRLTCVSCQDVGAKNRASTIAPQDALVSNYVPRAVLDDGRVTFTSREALVPKDVNGRADVYRYDGGRLTLITPGTGGEDAVFMDASADGKSIFFITAEGIVEQDRDGAFDLYVARVGGGIGSQNRRAESSQLCDGDGCQGAASPAPTITRPASGDVGDEASPPQKRRASLALKVRRVRGAASFEVSMRVSEGGTLTVSGRDFKTRRLRVARAGSASRRILLTTQARERLRRAGKRRIAVHVRFSASSGATVTKRIILTLTTTEIKRNGR